MSNKQPKVESLKITFVVFFIIGLAACYWMENSLGAFVILLVGLAAGSLARDVKYATQMPTKLEVDSSNVTLKESVMKEIETALKNNPPRRVVKMDEIHSRNDLEQKR